MVLDNHSRKHIAQCIAALYTYGYTILLKGNALRIDPVNKEILVPISLLPRRMIDFLAEQRDGGYMTLDEARKG